MSNGAGSLFGFEKSPLTERLNEANTTNPRHRPYMTGIGVAHFFSRHYRKAAELLTVSLDELPGWPTTYRFLAATCSHLGMTQKARETFDRLQKITRTPAPPSSAFRNPEHLELYSASLQAARGPA